MTTSVWENVYQRARSALAILSIAALVGGQMSVPASAQIPRSPIFAAIPPGAPPLYSVDRIMYALRNPSTSLTLVAAHRGYWRDYPENSWAAIVAAGYDMRFEIVEADIKPALNLEPVVFHDLVLNRGSTGRGPITAISRENFLNLSLRDRYGEIAEGSNVRPMDALETV